MNKSSTVNFNLKKWLFYIYEIDPYWIICYQSIFLRVTIFKKGKKNKFYLKRFFIIFLKFLKNIINRPPKKGFHDNRIYNASIVQNYIYFNFLFWAVVAKYLIIPVKLYNFYEIFCGRVFLSPYSEKILLISKIIEKIEKINKKGVVTKIEFSAGS